MIETENLELTLGKSPILHSLNFKAQAGHLTTIIGTNGSGKTTLVKALSGELFYSGKITINGDDIARKKPSEMALVRAVLQQSTDVSFPFLVREVVALGLLNSLHPEFIKKKLPEMALDKVDLAGYEGRFYHELSGGEQARVQLARVICQIWEPVFNGIPRWLFLDEPVASLDIYHQLAVMDIARGFSKAGGGVIAILHDLNLAAHYSDKIIVMDHGHIVKEGSPAAVLTTPMLREIYHCKLTVGKIPAEGVPFVLPQSAYL